MLNYKQQLIDILSDTSLKFDDTVKRFESTFTKNEYFLAGWIIQHMIHNNVQRIIILVAKSEAKVNRTLYSI